MEITEIVLEKRIRTKASVLLLTHADGLEELPKIGDRDKVSRLDNWRTLMVPGRKIRITTAHNKPVMAEIKIENNDTLVWDSTPTTAMDWVSFWSILNEDKNDIKIKRKEEKTNSEED